MGEPHFAVNPQPEKQLSNPHAADFQTLIRNMAREHDNNAGSQKKGVDVPASSASSSEHSSEQEDAPPRKRKKKVHHQEAPTPKVTKTPELDPTLVTFLKKSAKDPKKGIDRAWRGCQDKLLDISGPLTKN
ncbi:hypothetical protein NDU88_006809 [Pleurodeles waltl]|uniref:Uncharacterized protein n=1 Tax=Pleurodeles waltl TaxID=8319 RepID=A0AAV7LQ85_PLEWA|nr:hypothetical protein NDU88_006809 [Pleurodeles waltl]